VNLVSSVHCEVEAMKQALILIACLLSIAEAAGQDLNRLELGIHDLVEVKTVTGITLVVDPTKIVMAYASPDLQVEARQKPILLDWRVALRKSTSRPTISWNVSA
jgi:hypothetical protein